MKINICLTANPYQLSNKDSHLQNLCKNKGKKQGRNLTRNPANLKNTMPIQKSITTYFQSGVERCGGSKMTYGYDR